MKSNQEFAFKGIIPIGTSLYAYTAIGFFKPGYQVEINGRSIRLWLAGREDMNSPGIQEVNDSVLKIISNSSRDNSMLIYV